LIFSAHKMKTMTDPISAEQLQEVLRLHRLWLIGDTSGVRAYLSGANLTRAYLADANLADANLADANLTGANLSRANLADANLADANLTGANLSRANLSRAYLAGADLSRAYLAGATGNMRQVKSAQIERCPVVWTQSPDGVTTVQIGCQPHPLEWWETADEHRIAAIDEDGWKVWQRLGPIILSLIKASPATPWGSQSTQTQDETDD
jgi:hypothetical protein